MRINLTPTPFGPCNGDIIHINNEAQANAIFANQANDARYECERKVA